MWDPPGHFDPPRGGFRGQFKKIFEFSFPRLDSGRRIDDGSNQIDGGSTSYGPPMTSYGPGAHVGSLGGPWRVL